MISTKHFDELEIADNFLAKYVTKKCRNYNDVLISGGTSFLLMLESLSLQNNQVNFYLTDERDVKNSSSDSNLFSYNRLNYKNIRFNGFIPEKNYKKTLHNYENHLPDNFFNLCLLGVGEDGHIASIFPNQRDFIFNSKHSFYCHSENHKYNRYSLNLDYIIESKTIVLYFRGTKKIEAYNKFFNRDFYPLNKLIEQKEKVKIILANG